MRSLFALVIAGVIGIAAPAAPGAADPAPPRPAPAPAPRAAPAPAPRAGGAAPTVRVAPGPRSSAGPASPRASTAVRPAPAPSGRTVGPAVRPAPAPGTRYSPSYRYYPSYPYYPHYPYWAFGVGVAPFWWGLGWGWGSYPYYPSDPYYPYYPPAPAPYYPPEAPSAAYPPPAEAAPRETGPTGVTTQLSLLGGGHDAGGAGALAIGIDGRRLGLQASFGGLALDRLRGGPNDETAAVGWGLAHATWSLVSEAAYRVRLEIGASLLSMPDSHAFRGQPYARTVAVGPSFGVSGHARLAGPLGIEGHVRGTPTPVPVADPRLAATLRGGPFALALGWRAIDVSGDGEDGPQLHFSGPELGLSFWF
jgi:hypothetical protein